MFLTGVLCTVYGAQVYFFLGEVLLDFILGKNKKVFCFDFCR